MKIGTNLEIGNLAKVLTECFSLLQGESHPGENWSPDGDWSIQSNIGKVPNLKVGIKELSFPESTSASLLVAWQ